MENDLYGGLTIVLAILSYFVAIRQYRMQNYRIALWFIIFAGVILRVYTSCDLYLHAWDERFHALVAKNMMSHPFKPMLYENPVLPYDYRNWSLNHIWIHKQPLPLWSMAISMKIFGINEIAVRIPSLVLSILGIWIVYELGKTLYHPRVGLIAAYLFSINGLIIALTAGRIATDHIDVFFLFFVEAAVLFAVLFSRNKKPFLNVLCGISIGFAILSKWLPALIVLPVWMLLIWDSKKFTTREIVVHFGILCAVLAAVFLPWQIYIFEAFPEEARWERSFNIRHITEVLEDHGAPFYHHFERALSIYGELVILPFLWFLWIIVRSPVHYVRLLLLIWILIPYLFFSFAKTKMQAYTLFVAPAVFILMGLFWEYVQRYRSRFKSRWAVQGLMVLMLVLPLRFAVERIQPFSTADRNPAWTKELRALNDGLNDPANAVIVNVAHPIETMFYTNSTAYGVLPDADLLNQLSDKGYNVYIRETVKTGIGKENIPPQSIHLPAYNVLYRKWGH